MVFDLLEKNNDILKLKSWEKAAIGAINKLRSDFSELSDVVEPYTMALTLVSLYCVLVIIN